MILNLVTGERRAWMASRKVLTKILRDVEMWEKDEKMIEA